MAGSSKKVIFAAMIGNGLIAITKFIAASITGSSAMLSEGVHSVVDTGNQVLLLYGLKQAKKPADTHYPFGHGKEIYFWSFVVAILIFALGAGISIYEGIRHLAHPNPLADPQINYIVLGLSMLFEGVAWFLAFKEFSRRKGKLSYLAAVSQGKDPSLFVVLFEDSAAMLGLFVAFLGIWLSQVTGIAAFDGAASIVIGLILAGTAIWLAYETKGLLIGESADTEVVEGIRSLAQSRTEILRVNEILTMHIGPEYILVNMSVEFLDAQRTTKIETSVANLENEIKERFPRVKRIFIELEDHKEKAS